MMKVSVFALRLWCWGNIILVVLGVFGFGCFGAGLVVPLGLGASVGLI